jgi:phage shock protein C
MQNKKLYRSASDKIFSGVCGGLAEYLAVDATVLRLIWALVVVFSGFVPGVLVYLIAIFIMPERPSATVAEAPGPDSKG